MRSRKHVLLLLMGTIVALGSGCTLFERTKLENSAVQQFPSNDQDFDFWDTLAKQSIVCENSFPEAQMPAAARRCHPRLRPRVPQLRGTLSRARAQYMPSRTHELVRAREE